MKKIYKSLIVLILSLMVITNVSATSKWDTKRNSYGKTSADIDIKYDKENSKVIYTIPKNYSEKEIYFNIVDDLQSILEGKYVPGSSALFTIEIVNNSKYNYKYLNNSFTIDTLNWNDEFNSDKNALGDNLYLKHTGDKTKEVGTYIKDAYAFDGSIIKAAYSIDRTNNKAFTELYKKSSKTNGSYYYLTDNKECNVNSPCKEMFYDDILGSELIAQGYVNGIADLDKYYLDFYNKEYNLTAKSFYELPDNVIIGYGGLLSGYNNYYISETNSVLNAFGYDWFYNKGLMVSPVTDVNGNKITYNMLEKGNYFIGNYMRGENKVLEEVFRKDFENIAIDTANTLTQLDLNISGPNVTNPFQKMNFGYMISFKLEKEVKYGKLIVNYVDQDGNKLLDSDINEYEVDTEYKTNAKDITGYVLNSVDGNETGTIIEGTTEVTYIYEFVHGTGDIEEPVIKPEEKPTPDIPYTGIEEEKNNNSTNIILMSSSLVSLSLLILFRKKVK